MITFSHAARFLTILPVPGGNATRPAFGAPWFPLVGFMLGAILVGVDALARWGLPPLLASALVITAWEVLTGGLHLDGLADSLDGLGGGTPARSLEIMRDSRIGVFGSAGVTLALLAKVSVLFELTGSTRSGALFLVPALGRAAPLFLAKTFPAATPEQGQGGAFIRTVTWWSLLIALVLSFAGSLLLFWPWGGLIGALAFAVVWAWGALLTARFGGLTGDSLGGAVELTELAALAGLAALHFSKAI